MKTATILFSIILLIGSACDDLEKQETNVREKIKIDQDWKFHHGQIENAFQPEFDDEGWRKLDLPHDWTVEMPLDSTHPSGTAGGFVKGGIGWYRKLLPIPESYSNKKLYLQFDGIYENSTVWINGEKIGNRNYGYATHFYDVTNNLNAGENNLLAIQVDASRQPADRWFSGAGIYRHVWLHVTDPLHVPIWGTYVTTPFVSEEKAVVDFETEVQNDFSEEKSFEVLTEIFAPQGDLVIKKRLNQNIAAGKSKKISQQFQLENPSLWTVGQGNLYRINTSLFRDGELVDQYSTPFGVRQIAFTADEGFLLNGKKEILRGVNIHHDAGPLGAAVPAKVWERRFQKLKDLGVNTIRFSHNPHAPELLDLCDQMGFLAYDEIYDKWAIPWQNRDDSAYVAQRKQVFAENWKRDLTEFIDRDKNHPSVIIWSVGNETREQLFDPELGVTIGTQMMDLVKELDPSRKVTAAMHPRNKDSEFPSRLIRIFDVVSYNYETHNFADWRRQQPDMIFIASETKLYNNPFHTISFDTVDFSQNSWFEIEEWMAGQYIWAGIDYLGESFSWPDKGFRGGVLYTNGFAKPSTGFTQSIYSVDPMVKVAVHSDSLADFYNAQDTWQKSWWPPALVDHWNFAAQKNEMMDVYAFTNLEKVELFLNGKSLGEKSRKNFKDGVVRWQVLYQPGTLKAEARNGMEILASDQLVSAGKASALKLYSDKDNLTTDNDDVVHVIVQLEDADGRRNPLTNALVRFSLEGPGKIIGIDNGNLADHYDWKGNQLKLMDGRCLVILQADGESGSLTLKASGDGVGEDAITIQVNES